ncbi:small subunit processome component 20 homolog [Pomacea canaliculata]|uniref:small subunit processome component 20 homolog n=1 Tax=Pomacea canaliculata TaxID=400727 RepID=UPI000D7337CF|nr:small subunit processome component 20 homolog [Pomacea canaliculata]
MGRSHKETNTYRFQNFSERIAYMHFDVAHHTHKQTEGYPESDQSFFRNAIAKWVDLNCTQNFCDFREEISKFPCDTFVQLVHHAEGIMATIKKHLQVPDTLALEALLDLLVQMARDLGPDFYPHFREVFDILVQLLRSNSHDADILEKVFEAMAYLHKYLWRYLVKNIQEVYGYFSCLLTQSNRDYIQKFAAESFAFLMRKVKDYDTLLEFLFKDLEMNQQKTAGVGQLLFEMMKGVKQHFHTVSSKVFTCILQKLGPHHIENETQLPWKQVEETVEHMMKACATYTNRDQAGPLWTVLLNVLGDVHKSCLTSQKESQPLLNSHLCRLLRMLTVWLQHSNGSIISDPPEVAKALMSLLKELPWTEGLSTDLLKSISLLLQNAGYRLSVELTVQLLSSVFSADFSLKDMKLFAMSLISTPLFEKDVVPGFLSLITTKFDDASEDEQKEMLAWLTNVVLLKTTSPEDGSQLHRLQLYSLDFGRTKKSKKKNSFLLWLQSLVKTTQGNTVTKESLPLAWMAVTCLPHISILNRSASAKALALFWNHLNSSLSRISSIDQDVLLFVMHQAAMSLFLLDSECEVSRLLPFKDVIALLKLYPANLSVLHTADLYLSLINEEEDLFTSDTMGEIYQALEPNLMSGSHKIRLLTLHILTLFPVSVPERPESSEELSTIFSVSLAAEKTPLSVQDSRQRLMHLRKLDHSLVHVIMPAGSFAKMPLLYLMGTLLCPLTLLWGPVSELIATHARGMDREEFWEAFGPWLQFSEAKAEKELNEPEGIDRDDEDLDIASPANLLTHWLKAELMSERKPDYIVFRNHLWKAMQLFPEKCEPKSREIVPLFLGFLQKEYYNDMIEDIEEEKENEDSDNVTNPEGTVQDSSERKTMEIDGGELNLSTSQLRRQSIHTPDGISGGVGKNKYKTMMQSLLAHLELFAKFQNPRSLYQEAEVQDIYLQFLEHKNPQVQKVAFDCIMTYKYKYLTPYKENFERLLDNKTFKSEVVLFSVDHESSEIRQEHRAELLPVLMRILYGKMLSKAGNETSGRRRADTRRSIVLRFLAGCSSKEMQYFLGLVFGPFRQYVTDDPLAMVRGLAENLDLKKFVPPKKMKGVLGAVSIVMDKLGHLLEDNARWVLHLLLAIGAMCASCLKERHLVRPSIITQLKSVRQLIFIRLIQFLGDFDKFEFTDKEVEAILETFVWPQLDRLVIESKCQPSPLLRLFESWSLDPKYFVFLNKQFSSGGKSSLAVMFDLLVSPGLGHSVANIILKTIENMIEAEDEVEDDEPAAKRRRTESVSQQAAAKVPDSMLMLEPYIPALLTYIEGAVKNHSGSLVKELKSSGKEEMFQEMKILARVSAYVKKMRSVSAAVFITRAIFGNWAESASENHELEESTLESVLNLMKRIANPRPFYRSLLPLFVNVERRQSRVLLCQILKAFGEKVPDLADIAGIVENLNSWDPKRTEEPDYTLRLQTYRTTVQRLTECTFVDLDFILPLVYNCCFIIKNFDDLSLRDNATHCLVTIIQCQKRLTSDVSVYKELVGEAILPLVKKGLRSKQEQIRHEFLAVLQALVLAYPEHHDFVGLSGLCDTDVDADFFVNIRHIQLHKQTRALRRLSRYLHNYKLTPQQHMGFVVPLLYSYLLDPRYAKSGGILDASVDLTCMVCRQLPWESYFQLLRLYLSQLPRRIENQRIIIKVIVAILDGFHFDLSKSQFHIKPEPKAVEQKSSTSDATSDTNDFIVELDTVMDKPSVVEDDVAEEKEEMLSPETEDTGKTSLPVKKQKEFSADRLDVCPPGLATRVHRMMLQSLIPQLHKKLTEKVKSDEIHKMAGPKYAEDDEILRVPIAMAMVRLLQKLPSGALESRLPGILLRVCNFLKSRAESIRIIARDTLVKIALALGPRFLPFIVKEMRSVLTKGYQLHVLSFTLVHILKKTMSTLKSGDLDPAMNDLQCVFQEELFGKVSEEKGIAGIRAKTFEAKASKGFLAYRLMARFISPDMLGVLVKPLKNVLEGTHSQKTANKVRLVLQKVESGLVSNPAIDAKTMMIFIHTLTADNLPMLKEQIPTEKKEDVQKVMKPESCLLIPKPIPRGGIKPKTTKKATVHVLVEFGLLLLNSCLKKSMLKPEDSTHLALLDPLVPSFVECLSCKYIRVNAAMLRCLCWLLTFPVAHLKEDDQNYACAGAAKGDNQELLLMAFKAVTVLVREVKYYELSSEHLRVLLSFCESDLLDFTRQSTAFSVLKAILHRKLNVPELHELIKAVETMVVTAEAEHLRLQCRQVVLQYLLDYPLGKRLTKHLNFFIAQLMYELEDGRLSTLEMIASIFSTFPQDTLQKHAGVFLVHLTVTMVKDESEKCRKLAALAIKSLLGKVDVPTMDSLFSIAFLWITGKKTTHRTYAAQLCSLFVEVEAAHFQKAHLPQVLPIIIQQIDPEKFEKPQDVSEEEELDQCLFNFLTLVTKIFLATDILRNARWTNEINIILGFVEQHLLYPHTWVRLRASEIFGHVFASLPQDGHEMVAYIAENPRVKIRKLVLDMCSQLQAPILDKALALQVVKNLVFLSRNIHHIVTENQLDEEEQKKFSVCWLARKMVREANFEVINNPKFTLKRIHVFKWIAAVVSKLDIETMKALLPIVLPSLQRETADQSHSDQYLKTAAQEIIAFLKKKIGINDFTATYASVQQARNQRKEKRKADRAISAVKTPEVAARKRMKKTKAKIEAKKRKIEQKKVRVKKSKLSVYLKER